MKEGHGSMKRTLIVLCAAFTFGFVGYLGAQPEQYGGGQNTSSKSSKEHSKKSREVTLSGCLEQGASSNLFVLRNATEENQAGGMSMGTSGSSERNEQQGQPAAMDFQLVGKDLKKYVGQRVEVHGVVEPMKENKNESGSMSGMGGMSGSESGTQSTTGSQSGSMSGGAMSGQATAGPITHRVKVRSVKQLGSSCQ